ncbi:MAG: class I SAM-dependent methyltransferase [Candidatus Pelethousia sp.]|nr:class I SAM-dependent methyltransferase [Candidatus Pelethousia sp.]
MHVHLRPRLAQAADMLGASAVVADIGSDHGRLAVALLQRGVAQRVIASDVSGQSLKKAEALALHCQVAQQMDFRVGDGLSTVSPREADAIIMAGMGGLLMVRLLREGEKTARAAERIVLQPQGNAAELRRFLYENAYCILEEAIVLDSGRYYQFICAKSGRPRPLPAGWPKDYLELGPVAYEKGDSLLLPLARKYKAGHEKRLARARQGGFEPTLLLQALGALDTIIAMLEDHV